MSAQIVDDRDPTITFNANHWALQGTAEEFDGTSHFCNIPGGTATFAFDGPASVSVFGTSQSATTPGRATYDTDNGQIVSLRSPAQPSNDQFQVTFFETTVSSIGSHTLLVSTLDGAPYILDFIQVVPLNISTSPNSTQSSAASPTSLIFTQTLPITVFLTTTLPAPSTDAGSPDTTTSTDSGPNIVSHHTTSGVIVGSTLGSLIFVPMLLCAIFYLIKRRRRNWTALSLHQQAVLPFILDEVEAAPPSYSNVIQPEKAVAPNPPPRRR